MEREFNTQLLRFSADKEYLLLPAALWDGNSDVLLRDPAIYIKKGLISAVTPNGKKAATGGRQNMRQADILRQAEIIRLPDITLMPGLIDCHIHLSMDCLDLQQVIKEWDEHPDTTEKRVRDELAAYLECGIVAVRDGGDKKNIGLTAGKKVSSGEWTGPQVVATGQAIYRKDKYGTFLGPGISSLQEVEQAVRQLVSDGADQLKVVVSGLVSFKNFGVVGPPQFTGEELTQIVHTGHAHGLKVMAHASSRAAVEIAVAAGVDSVEHGYFVSDRDIARMADRGIAWVPTAAPLGNLIKNGHPPYPGADLDVIKRTLELQLKKLAKAADAGVLLGIGTDAGANMVLHGFSYYDELSYFRAAGLDNLTVLRAATRNAAKIAGLDNIMGVLEPGKEPYMTGVKGSPPDSLTPLKKPCLICLPATVSRVSL